MEEEPKQLFLPSIPKELTRGMISYADIPTCGALGRVCCDSRQFFQDQVLCKHPTELPRCSSPMCVYLSHEDNFDAGTKALVFYAKEYKKDPENNKYAWAMCNHLWQHGQDRRNRAIRDVLGVESITFNDCVDIYAGEYGKKEMGNLWSMNTSLAKKMREAAKKENSRKLKTFLVNDNLLAAKMMLLTPDLQVQGTWSGHKYGQQRSKYEFGYDKRDILECACDIGNFDIINTLGNCYTQGMVMTMIHNYKIDVLEKFILKNYEELLKVRCRIWGLACYESSWRGNSSVSNPELDDKIFETIMRLLFSGDVDTQDEHGASLLYFAVAAQSKRAVDYLIQHNINVNVLDPNGFAPLYSAYEDPEIVTSLLAAGADVNAHNAGGRTALMAAGMHRNCNTNALKSMNLLLNTKADVNAIDNDGRSALHYYAQYSECNGGQDLIDLISTLIQRGVDVHLKDNQGNTAYNYAQKNGNTRLMEILSEC